MEIESKIVNTTIRKLDAKTDFDFDLKSVSEYYYGSINEIFFCNECNSIYEWIVVGSNGYRCPECYSNDLDIIKNDELEITKFFRKRKLEKINAS